MRCEDKEMWVGVENITSSTLATEKIKRKTSVLLQRLYSQLKEEQKRDIDYPSLQAVAQTYGVGILETPKDGNCQFHCAATTNSNK